MGLEIFERGELPQWLPVRQALDATDIGDVRAAMARQFQRRDVGERILPGGGSRSRPAAGASIASTRSSARSSTRCRQRGAEPFIVPAMGSHGGATAEGQRELIAHYGITEADDGVPDSLQHGDGPPRLRSRDDVPVWIDRNAYRGGCRHSRRPGETAHRFSRTG